MLEYVYICRGEVGGGEGGGGMQPPLTWHSNVLVIEQNVTSR